MPVTQIWMRPDPFSSASTASVQLSGWAKGNLKKTCTVVRPLKVPDLLAALVPRGAHHRPVTCDALPGCRPDPGLDRDWLVQRGALGLAEGEVSPRAARSHGACHCRSLPRCCQPTLMLTVRRRRGLPHPQRPSPGLWFSCSPPLGQSRTLNCPGLTRRKRCSPHWLTQERSVGRRAATANHRVLYHRVISLPMADEIPVQRRGGEKRRVVADPGGGTVQDEYPAGPERGAHPVRDDDQRARPGRERGLGLRGSDGIKMARRLVEDGQPGRDR